MSVPSSIDASMVCDASLRPLDELNSNIVLILAHLFPSSQSMLSSTLASTLSKEVDLAGSRRRLRDVSCPRIAIVAARKLCLISGRPTSPFTTRSVSNERVEIMPGVFVGTAVGVPVGVLLGICEGKKLGTVLGIALGSEEGYSLGIALGWDEGRSLGAELGFNEGASLGESVG